MSTRVLVMIAATVVGLAACSSPPAPPPAPITIGAPTAPAPTVAAQDAAAILARLQAAKLPIGATGTVTAANDANHLLGRPNGYTTKVYWVDTSIDPAQVVGGTVGNVSAGGSIESYPDVAGARNRAQYIQAIAKSAPIFGEYDYVVGTSVLRLSQLLTPAQVQSYEAAA